MNSKIEKIAWGEHLKATLILGLPITGSHLAQMAIGLTDTVMVGWYGVDELAAVALASSLFFVFFIVGSGPAMAVMPMAATAEGEGDQRQPHRDHWSRTRLWHSSGTAESGVGGALGHGITPLQKMGGIGAAPQFATPWGTRCSRTRA